MRTIAQCALIVAFVVSALGVALASPLLSLICAIATLIAFGVNAVAIDHDYSRGYDRGYNDGFEDSADMVRPPQRPAWRRGSEPLLVKCGMAGCMCEKNPAYVKPLK